MRIASFSLLFFILIFGVISISNSRAAGKQPDALGPKWEYRFSRPSPQFTQEGFSELGADRWEFCGFMSYNNVENGMAIFKRPLIE
jgi:hypothetical protein